jgi:hypothetical protein
VNLQALSARYLNCLFSCAFLSNKPDCRGGIAIAKDWGALSTYYIATICAAKGKALSFVLEFGRLWCWSRGGGGGWVVRTKEWSKVANVSKEVCLALLGVIVYAGRVKLCCVQLKVPGAKLGE